MRSSNYTLCSSPRSGTTLLCGMLADTGVAGRPDSFFREKSFADWCASWTLTGPYDLTDPEFATRYLAAARAEGLGGTDVFGLRLMGTDLDYARGLLERLCPGRASDHARFEAAFGPMRYVHLSRRDKLAEAVSYVRAEQSGLWHGSPDGTALEQIAPAQPDGFDADVIAARLKMLTQFDADWQAWFAAEGITPLRLTYERLAEDPQHGLAQVLTHIGCDPALAANVQPSVRKLADTTSAEWIARFRALERDV